MAESATISTLKPTNPAFDYNALRAAGIQLLEQTGSSGWTDYNVHDPGITTLELLCFAMTDLSYRCNYSIPDLLASATDNGGNMQRHFYSAGQIFPNKAVTINDYRKLIINLIGIKNAWLRKSSREIFADLVHANLSHQQPLSRKWETVDIAGYYDVLLEFDINVPEVNKTDTKNAVRALLMANRNLCEDFVHIDEISSQSFILCSEMEIDASADPFDTLAQIFFNIQLLLTPLIRFYRLNELFDLEYTADQIFEGPWLSGGYIREEDLTASDLKSEIHLSDIMGEIMKVNGISNILNILFNPGGQTDELPNKWVVAVGEGKQPVMDIAGSNVLFYIDGIPFRPDMTEVQNRYKKMMSDYISGNDRVTAEDIAYDTGQFKNVENYYSIQNHYPKNYGISHWGLPADAGNERIVQAKQFQGFLYLFDQQLANFLSQLSHLRNLFSFQNEANTYFATLADSFKDARDLFQDEKEISVQIQDAAEKTQSQPYYQRRNLFLDHLLARFGESFADYVNILQYAFPSGADASQQQVVDAKTNFLQRYPDYSSQRFNGYNYTGDQLWTMGNVTGSNISGLEKRLEHLLGFVNVNRRGLVNIFSSVKSRLVSNVEQYRFEITDNRSNQILLKSGAEMPDEQDTTNALADAVDLAVNLSNFAFIENATDHTITYQVKNEAGDIIAVGDGTYPTKAAALRDVRHLITLLSSNQSEEGLFLIEHLLLLPDISPAAGPVDSPPSSTPDDNGFMPICVDDNCDDCDSADPYSFRVSVVLPAYAPRFLNMDFRRYCERVIRMEMPSHVFVKICWVNNEQLRDFENTYRAWLNVKAGTTTDDGHQLLETFVQILTTLKTVYPVAKLEDCSGEQERTLFLLNQNALGTLKK